MTCGSTNLTDEKTSKTSKRSAADSNNDPHPTISMDLKSKRAKIEVTLAASEAGQMTQIESEFQILKSLIPNIANKQQINELEIIDACVSYIEALQSQLELVKPISHHHELAETDTESEDEVDLNNNNDVQNDGKNAQL